MKMEIQSPSRFNTLIVTTSNNAPSLFILSDQVELSGESSLGRVVLFCPDSMSRVHVLWSTAWDFVTAVTERTDDRVVC
jgi:hypothetical protein